MRDPLEPLRAHRVEGPVEDLVARLGSDRGLVRKQARRALVRRGEESVPALLEALGSERGLVRMEAAEALVYIGSPRAAPALVEALDDPEFGVRWLAAEGLIALRCEGLVPLLEGVTRRSGSLWFRQAAHHVLRDHWCDRWRTLLQPVLRALETRVAEDTAPVAAGEILRRLSEGARR